MNDIYKQAGKAALISIIWAAILIVIEWLEPGDSWSVFGVYPRYTKSLLGIITYPFIHGDAMDHLASNLGSLIPLSFSLYFFYPKLFWRVVAGVHVFSGIWVWVAARPSWHIGASGVIFGMAFFLIMSGWFRRKTDAAAAVVGLLAVFFNGSVFLGALPWFNPPHVSWEGHFFGSVAGILLAFYYRKHYLPPPPVDNSRFSPYIPDQFWDYKTHQPPPPGLKHKDSD
ncbi:MAG: rhomboid family intramembrane serine protease [Bacteroidia bacterium]